MRTKICENQVENTVDDQLANAEQIFVSLYEIKDAEERLKKFKELENIVVDLNQTFRNVSSVLVEDQQDHVDTIGKHSKGSKVLKMIRHEIKNFSDTKIDQCVETISEATKNLKDAEKYQENTRKTLLTIGALGALTIPIGSKSLSSRIIRFFQRLWKNLKKVLGVCMPCI